MAESSEILAHNDNRSFIKMLRKNEIQNAYQKNRRMIDADYREKVNKTSREFNRKKYNENEEYKQYKREQCLKRYYLKKEQKQKEAEATQE